MKIDIVERGGYKVSQRLDRILREKLERLGKYFDDEPNAKVVCQKEAKQEKLEITITSKGLLFRSEGDGAHSDTYTGSICVFR